VQKIIVSVHLLPATASKIDRTSRVLPDQQDADISWLFLYRHGTRHDVQQVASI
jgi:hypothetical protein